MRSPRHFLLLTFGQHASGKLNTAWLWVLGLILALALLLGGRFAFTIWQFSTMKRPEMVARVRLLELEAEAYTRTYETYGSLEAVNNVTLKAPSAGRVVSILFSEGQRVSAGKPLFSLQADRQEAITQQRQLGTLASAATVNQAQAQVRQANAQLNKALTDEKLARSEARRYQQLYEGEFLSDLELESQLSRLKQAETEVKVARQGVQAAQSQLNALKAQVGVSQAQVSEALVGIQDAIVRAPFAGVVAERLVDEGQYVQVNENLASFVSPEGLEVSFALPLGVQDQVRAGAPVLVTLTQTGAIRYGENAPEPVQATITYRSPSIDAQTQTRRYKARLDTLPAGLVPGQHSQISVVLSRNPDALFVPEQAVVYKEQRPYVWVSRPTTEAERQPKPPEAKPKKGFDPMALFTSFMMPAPKPLPQGSLVARQVPVVLGQKVGDRIEIKAGVRPGQTVITDGFPKIRPGIPILPVEEEATKKEATAANREEQG